MVYYIVEEIENLGDEYKYLAQYLVQDKVTIKNKDILQLLEMQNNLVRQFYSLYAKFTTDKAKELADHKNKLSEKINKAMKKANVGEVRILCYLGKMAVIVNNMTGPLMTMKVPEICDNTLK